MTRIQYEIPDDIHHQAKAAAAQQGISLKEFIIRAISYQVAYPPIILKKGRNK